MSGRTSSIFVTINLVVFSIKLLSQLLVSCGALHDVNSEAQGMQLAWSTPCGMALPGCAAPID
jgi:hypothetical protein